MSSLISKSSRISRDQKLVEGFKKHLLGTSLIVAGKSYTAEDAVAALQARIDSVNAVIAARAEWQNLVKTEATMLLQTKLFANGVRAAVMIMFGQTVDTLADFGLSPRKVRKTPAPTKKVQTVLKAKATRVARHTVGPKAKLKIKGVVPETAPETPAPLEAQGAPKAPPA